jgi:hypothetical protein
LLDTARAIVVASISQMSSYCGFRHTSSASSATDAEPSTRRQPRQGAYRTARRQTQPHPTAADDRLTVPSSWLLGAELGLSHVTIVKVWGKWNLQPWRSETFKFSTDPDLARR